MTNAVWEDGYKLCLDSFKLADNLEHSKRAMVAEKLRNVSLAMLFDLARVPAKPSRLSISRLKQVYMSSQKLNTLIMFINDLEYLQTNEYLEFSGVVNVFISKVKKVIRYNERKLKKA